MYRYATTLATCLALVAAHGAAAADVDFDKQIRPIFMKHCAGCHGEKKGLGKLRLHTVEAIQKKAAADDHLLVAGKPDESELYERLVLPADHKKRMPKKADPLPKEKTELIRLWIEQGALFAAAAALKPSQSAEQDEAEHAATEAAPISPPLPEVPAADTAAIQRLTDAGAQVLNLFTDSRLLQVSYALRDEAAGDAELALLADVAEQVYSLNLSGSKASSAGLAVVAKLKNLAQLHLENSAATDEGLAHLAALSDLQYLNVYGTAVTDAGMAHLEGLKHLRKLYLWKTKVSYDVAMALEKKIPGLEVNLGFDHPVIARKRITKELERAEAHAKETAADKAKLKLEFDAATKSEAAAAKRLGELKKELAALDGKPAAEEKDDTSAKEKKEAPASAKETENDKAEPAEKPKKQEKPKAKEEKKAA